MIRKKETTTAREVEKRLLRQDFMRARTAEKIEYKSDFLVCALVPSNICHPTPTSPPDALQLGSALSQCSWDPVGSADLGKGDDLELEACQVREAQCHNAPLFQLFGHVFP